MTVVQGNIPHLYMINIVYGYAMAHYSIAQFTLTTSINMDFKIKKMTLDTQWEFYVMSVRTTASISLLHGRARLEPFYSG